MEDATTVYRWLLQQRKPANSIVVAGDSAGGGLTLATLLALKDTGDPMPGAAVLLSPWTDLELTGDSMLTRVERDPMVTVDLLEGMAKMYANGVSLRDPRISPLYGDLSGLPPMLIQVGDAEILLDDSTRLAERAKAVGVDVTLDVWDEMFHVFQAFAQMLPEGQRAIDRIGEYVKERIHTRAAA